MSETKLLPCPFCNAQLESYALRWQHPLSGSCLLSGYSMLRGTREIELWNTRKPLERIVEQLEEQEKECNKYWQEFTDDEALGGLNAYGDAIEIVKEEGGLND